MTVSSSEIWQRLQTDGLASRTQCQQWRESLLQKLDQEALSDATSVLKGLIALGVINAYQARALSGSTTDPLRFGEWLILGRVPGQIWKDWLQIRRAIVSEQVDSPPASSKLDGRTSQEVTWARWLTAESVRQLGGAKSLVARGKKWSQLEDGSVQLVEEPILEKNRVLLRLKPMRGQSLHHCLAEVAQSPEQILLLVRSMARSLTVLHEHNIVYGVVRPDRFFWHQQEGLRLVCEPSEPSECIHSEQSLVLGARATRLLNDDLGGLPEKMFVPPELLDGSDLPGPSTDVYSLAATGWWLLNRTTSLDIEQLRSLRGIDCGRLGIPQTLAECLKRGLAQDPQVRYPDAGELLKDLDASGIRSSNTTPLAVPVTSKRSQVKRRRRTLSVFVPLIASCAFLLLALAVMTWSGAFSSDNRQTESATSEPATSGDSKNLQRHHTNPLLQHFQLVESQDAVWAPPSPPSPIDLAWLAPGVQLLAVIHPARVLRTPNFNVLAELLRENQPLAKWLEREFERVGLPLDELHRLTIAVYSPSSTMSVDVPSQPVLEQQFEAEFPEVILRVELSETLELDHLKSRWRLGSEVVVDVRGVLSVDDNRAIYLPPEGLRKDSVLEGGVQVFCIGSKTLIAEAADLAGAVSPINPHLKRLLDRSNSDYDFCLLSSPRFLFGDGKAIMAAMPPKMQELLESSIGYESRALLVQSHCNQQWYWEVQSIAGRDSDAPLMLKNWIDQASGASSHAEEWLLRESPHTYWRALAVRFPQMLRLWNRHSRFGIEDGVALANGYLPCEASSNMMAAAWISMQEGVFLSQAEGAVDSVHSDGKQFPRDSSSDAVLNMDEFLNCPIRLSFEQEPIERALALIGEEANQSFPAGSRTVRFELDGSAFQKAGITRNQPIRQFQAKGESVRQVLTELTKRGNPSANVVDTRDVKQQLLWIVQEDPASQGDRMILLTTRDQAVEKRWKLPQEFAEGQDE